MAKPTHGPKENIAGQRLIPNSVLEPALGASVVGPTAVADSISRQLQVVTLYNSGDGLSAAVNKVVFRAPPSGAQLTYVGFIPGTQQYHAGAEADTWTFELVNKSTAATLSAQTPSLSNQTLAATSAKSIPLNNNNSTLNAGAILEFQLGVSGTPVTLTTPILMVEWQPVNNA